MQHTITDDLDALLAVLPPRVREAIAQMHDRGDLLEIVLDLGRPPEGRFPDREVILSDTPISMQDLDDVVGRIGAFGDDNRAGIERTLHRISAIRNRRGHVVGLTCRVGRAIQGTVALIRDVVEQGNSILILGRPGVGKTTLLREAARVLADELGKRVVVVDTSNEIAGDGDVPHPGIGRARRMQVARPAAQHQVMIEAVENHMPEVIVIDEIGTELEALAARTIAERGVQAVTLGDEEARRRGTQKTVLERKAPPTFDVLVEQEERNLVGVHLDVAASIDGLLRGESPQREMRERQQDGSVRRWVEHAPRAARADGVGLPTREAPIQREELGQRSGRGTTFAGQRRPEAWWEEPRDRERANGRAAAEGPGGRWLDPELARSAGFIERDQAPREESESATSGPQAVFRKRRVYAMGINRAHLEQAIRELGLPAVISRDERDADAVLVLKSLYRRQPDRVDAAHAAGLPVYVLRGTSVDRLREALADMYRGDVEQARRGGGLERAAREGDDDQDQDG